MYNDVTNSNGGSKSFIGGIAEALRMVENEAQLAFDEVMVEMGVN